MAIWIKQMSPFGWLVCWRRLHWWDDLIFPRKSSVIKALPEEHNVSKCIVHCKDDLHILGKFS